MIVEAKK